jgi:sec-independent protein translocase protein TatB
MEIFGVGPSELIFVILLAIIILGPKDMQKAGRSIGRFLNQLVRSDSWKVFQKTSAEIRNLPRNLMREANMELEEANAKLEEANTQLQEMDKEIRQTIDPRPQPSASPVSADPAVGNPAVEPAANLPPSNEAASLAQTEPPTVKPTEDDTNKHD